MATTRKTGFSTPREGEWRILAQAIDNIREQLGQLDGRVTQALSLIGGNQSVKQIQVLQAQIVQLSAQLSALGNSGPLIANLLAQPNGLVVLRDGALITRVLVGDIGISVTYPDGHDSNPLISLVALNTAQQAGDGWPWGTVDDAVDEWVDS